MRRSDKYILIGRDPVPCDDLLVWAEWFEHFDRTIARDYIAGMYEVSTIFLGVDMNIASMFRDEPGARPLLFETLVFKLDAAGDRRGTQTGGRWSTYDEAEAEHAEIVESLRRSARG